MSLTVHSTGKRLTWQSNTFIKTLILVNLLLSMLSSLGPSISVICEIIPSAGLTK